LKFDCVLPDAFILKLAIGLGNGNAIAHTNRTS
jgi:hypothetical protein